MFGYQPTYRIDVSKVTISRDAEWEFFKKLAGFVNSTPTDKVYKYAADVLQIGEWCPYSKKISGIPTYAAHAIGVVLFLYDFDNCKIQIKNLHFYDFPPAIYREVQHLFNCIAIERNLKISWCLDNSQLVDF